MTPNERIFPSRTARYSSPSLGLVPPAPASSPPQRLLSPRSLLANSLLPATTSSSSNSADFAASRPPMDRGAAVFAPPPLYNALQTFPRFQEPTVAEFAHHQTGAHSQPGSTNGSLSDEDSGADLAAGVLSGEEDGQSTSFKKRRRERRERKPTHLVRREEKMALEAEIAALQEQLESLKTQALVNKSLHVKSHTQAPVMNRILRESVQSRQLALADVQGMVSNYVRKQHDITPINSLIRLGHDRDERHRYLLGTKQERIEASRRFFEHRCRGLDLTKQFSESERFETDRGDYCSIQFDVTQFPGITSVRDVFDAVLQHIYNVEISISEMLGSITIREDDDSGTDGVRQYRLVSSSPGQSVPVETNSIQFSDFREASAANGGHESGIVIGDFVDEDDLYPYRPNSRQRKDVTAVIEIVRLALPARPGSGRRGEEFVVIAKRWSMVKLHHTDLPMSIKQVQQSRDEIGRWADEVIRSMQRTLAQ